MRKNNESVMMQLEICEEADEYKFRYVGDTTKVIIHLCTAIVSVLKSSGVTPEKDDAINHLVEGIAVSLKQALKTK